MTSPGDGRGTWIPANTFALRLVQVRRAAGDLSQVEAATACGLDDGSWSNWERGAKPRDMERVVRAICQGLGVNRDWLAFGDPPEHTRAYLTEDGKEAPIILGMSPSARTLQPV
jgi:transcriptional regulator with XRE-family HTH domain